MADKKTTEQERAERHAGGSPRAVDSVDVSEDDAAAQAEAIRKMVEKQNS